MVIVMNAHASEEAIDLVSDRITELGFQAHLSRERSERSSA